MVLTAKHAKYAKKNLTLKDLTEIVQAINAVGSNNLQIVLSRGSGDGARVNRNLALFAYLAVKAKR